MQNLLSSAASFAACVHHFTQELDEFWAFSELLVPISRELSLCCTSELVPLMDLPSVSKARARQLYKAGYRTLADVAKSTPNILVQHIEYLSNRVAQQMIAAAKVLCYEKAEALRDEADLLLDLLPQRPLLSSSMADDTMQTQASNLSFMD